MTKLPQTQRVVELAAYDGSSLRVVERPLRAPRAGEVVVRMHAAPINPSDLAFLKGLYGIRKPLPCVPGFEGCGTVVAAGGVARALIGRRVACAAMEDGDGTWAEYMITRASRCAPLRPKISDEQGATLLVNPLTAWVLFDRIRKGRHRAAAQTAAASALGRMLVRLAVRHRVPMVHIVRRAEQVEELRALGAEHLVDTSRPDADSELARLFRELGVTLAFDAVAGDLPERLLAAMPPRGRVILYGALSEQPSTINPGTLIFGDRAIEAFWLTSWLRHGPALDRARAMVAVQRMPELKSEVRARVPLAEAARAISEYATHMTGGKLLLTPNP
jgi:NADPH:quinone reductase-like Zn-dependent oxidoreductase